MIPSTIPGRYWHKLDDGRIQCDLCPRFCRLGKDGQRGLCFVRARRDDRLVLTTYGRSSGFCVDPIEKKPLNHFLPGTPVLSFGTAGCNLACKFCQNWDISKSRQTDTLAERASPDAIADKALALGCRSVAYTYNDPVIFLEYAMDTAKACRARGLKSVAVTAGYLCDGPRREFFAGMDAANVDLKALSEAFYYKLTGGHLRPVLDTLEYIHRDTDCWLEITTLLIPGYNDGDDELSRMCDWLVAHLDVDVPLHFSAFHPDYKLTNPAATPVRTLQRARGIALGAGLRYVYLGNVHDAAGDSTYCPGCGARVIERDWYRLGEWRLGGHGQCNRCGYKIAGVFESMSPGDWGPRRLPVTLLE